MTISSDIRTAGPFTGTGLVSVYAFAFKVFAASEVVATSTNTSGALTTLTQPAHYTASLNPNQNTSPGGTITLAAPLASGYTLEIGSEIIATQGASLPNQGGWFPAVVEDALDRLTILAQQMGGGTSNRNLRVPELGGIDDLPSIVDRAGKLLSFDPVTGAPEAVAAADQSATQLAIDLASTAAGDGAAMVGFSRTEIGSIYRTVHAKLVDSISVLDFGADPTGVSDSTDAFNRATSAASPWSSNLEYNVFVPAGKYKVSGTVYVRKGQTLYGSGHGTFIDLSGNTETNSFMLGRGSTGIDPGGSPVRIANMWTSGGCPTRGAVFTDAAGFSIHSLFMTFPGIGLEIAGADGLISDIEIDQCLSAVYFSACQNIALSNFNVYLPNYGFSFNSDCRDITISNGIIEYPQYAAVLFGDAQTNIKSVAFTGVEFLMNAQYTTLSALIYKRASSVDASFTGCTFRNWYQYAVVDDAGVGCRLSFYGCIFDGARSTSAYDQSTTARVLKTGGVGANGSYTFFGCEYRNLLGEIAHIRDGLTLLSFNGGVVDNCPQNRLVFSNTAGVPNIHIKGVVGFAHESSTATHRYITLPHWSGSTVWDVKVKGNTFAVGNTFYAAGEGFIAAVTYQFDGAAGILFADKLQLWATPNRLIPGQLNTAVEFGTTPGGGGSSGFVLNGSICISIAVSAANAVNFSWSADAL